MTEELNEPKPIKKYARFTSDSHIQIETRTAEDLPTDNTEDGSVWHEVEEHFPDSKHLIVDSGVVRPMSDEEHGEWQAGIDLAGALMSTRHKRNALLKESDWIETAPMSDELKTAWRNYRQALRDLPESVTGYDVEWPVQPA
mgnify:CR=1 FL=1